MKKLVLFIMAVVTIGSASMAQNVHQKFMGIPMDGSVTQFSQKLQQKGLKKLTTRDGVEVLMGTFATTPDCTFIVVGNDARQMTKVCVAFPSRERWSDLSSEYDGLKTLLTQKYGEPSAVVEEVRAQYSREDVLHHLMMDNATWGCGWSTEHGIIELEIKVVSYDCMVFLTYYDDASRKETIEKVLEEL